MTSRTSFRASAIFPAVALVLFGAGGCALASGSGTSAESARDALYGMLDDTQAELGGEWENKDDPTPRGCVIPVWIDGTQYPALRVGEAPEDIAVTARAAALFWRGTGMETSRSDIAGAVEVTGETEVGERIVLRISDESMTLQAESECRPAPKE